MIDTIRFQFPQPRPLHQPSRATQDGAKAHEDWQAFHDYIKANGTAQRGLVLVHRASGIRIYCHGDAVVAAEASLPRVLYSDNCSLITSQSEIDEGLSFIEQFIGQWASANTGPREYTRVDLVIQVRIPGHPASALIQTIGSMRHPSCRIRQREWLFNGSVNGCYHEGGDMIIKAYDKGLEDQVRRRVAEENRESSNVARIEISLTGNKLISHLGDGESQYPDYLDFPTCYRAYRRILGAFGPVPYSPTVTLKIRQLLVDLLARAHYQGWPMEDGRSVMDHIRSCSDSPVTKRAYLRQIAGRNLSTMNIDWGEIFPEAWPPPHLAFTLNQQFGAAATMLRRRQALESEAVDSLTS